MKNINNFLMKYQFLQLKRIFLYIARVRFRNVWSMRQSEDRTVKVGDDQEMAQSERNSHSKIRGVGNQVLRTTRIFRKPSEQLFLNRWPLSYTNLFII